MANRLVRWFTYNVVFGLFPLLVSIVFHSWNHTLSTQRIMGSPEALFFALMVSVTALGDISEIAAPVGWDLLFRICWSCLLIGAFWSAILYGFLLYDNISGLGLVSSQGGSASHIIVVAVSMGLVSTFVEGLIGRIQDTRELSKEAE